MAASHGVVMFVQLEVDPKQLDKFMEVAEEDAKGSRAEEGCLRFDVLKEQGAENKFVFYEVYKDDDAISAHKTTKHYKMWAEFKAQEPKPILNQTVLKYNLATPC
mmetsp:Transcript_117976/g.345551  ORF Transcript_117976/g.345551 Transcript_117976/m.345551 type:complete len:105 (+) Transcript_117976:71-385(+)